jgi:murein DD-endopeptidase MepM/ murein hydrolase activator NlpD
MIVDPFLRPVSGYDFMTPTDRGPHPGIDYGLSYEEIGLPFAVQVEQEGQLDQGIGGNELIGKIVGTPYEIILAHLDRFRRQVGDVVPAGADIAESGATGVATGPHLHLQILDDRVTGSTWAERSVDPRAVLQEVSTMQAIGGQDPGGGQTHGADGCPEGQVRNVFGVCVVQGAGPHGQGTGNDPITGQPQTGLPNLPNPLAGVPEAIAGAQAALGQAIPKYAVMGTIALTIGIFAFGGVKRIAD